METQDFSNSYQAPSRGVVETKEQRAARKLAIRKFRADARKAKRHEKAAAKAAIPRVPRWTPERKAIDKEKKLKTRSKLREKKIRRAVSRAKQLAQFEKLKGAGKKALQRLEHLKYLVHRDKHLLAIHDQRMKEDEARQQAFKAARAPIAETEDCVPPEATNDEDDASSSSSSSTSESDFSSSQPEASESKKLAVSAGGKPLNEHTNQESNKSPGPVAAAPIPQQESENGAVDKDSKKDKKRKRVADDNEDEGLEGGDQGVNREPAKESKKLKKSKAKEAETKDAHGSSDKKGKKTSQKSMTEHGEPEEADKQENATKKLNLKTHDGEGSKKDAADEVEADGTHGCSDNEVKKVKTVKTVKTVKKDKKEKKKHKKEKKDKKEKKKNKKRGN